MDERIAVRFLKNRDLSGLQWLVAEYQIKARQTAFLITRDEQAADDVVQDAFIQAYRSISHFDLERSFLPWFMKIVTNLAIKAAQAQSHQLSTDGDGAEVDFEQLLTDGGRSIEAQAEANELKERVWQALGELSPRQRAAVVERYFLESSESEMSRSLEVAPGTVKWLLHEARKNLSAILSPERNEK